jgi:hypothetical protein
LILCRESEQPFPIFTIGLAGFLIEQLLLNGNPVFGSKRIQPPDLLSFHPKPRDLTFSNVDALAWDVQRIVCRPFYGSNKRPDQRPVGKIKRPIRVSSIVHCEAAASVGVAHFTADFNAESSSQDESAERWLKATAGVAVLTLAASIALVFVPIQPDATTPQVIQMFTSKVVILGLLFTATIWCGRLYKAARHQGSINKHRANALRTFQAFTKAASDDAARNAILMETTKSIFAITPTGYLDNESAPDGGFRIVEVVKHATQAVASVK